MLHDEIVHALKKEDFKLAGILLRKVEGPSILEKLADFFEELDQKQRKFDDDLIQGIRAKISCAMSDLGDIEANFDEMIEGSKS